MLLIFSLIFILTENVFLLTNADIATANSTESPAFFEDFEQLDTSTWQIRLNHWLADPKIKWAVDWLGKVDDKSLPSEVYYDWIRYEPECLVKN